VYAKDLNVFTTVLVFPSRTAAVLTQVARARTLGLAIEASRRKIIVLLRFIVLLRKMESRQQERAKDPKPTKSHLVEL
jgi:hypothetical protein